MGEGRLTFVKSNTLPTELRFGHPDGFYDFQTVYEDFKKRCR